MCSWFRRFVKNFTALISPINDTFGGRKKNNKWTSAAEESFLLIKKALVSVPILSQPDFSQPFVIKSDACDTGVGGVSIQTLEGKERGIAFATVLS